MGYQREVAVTTPSPETLEREKDKLYVTDAELIRRIGLPEKEGARLIKEMDAKHRITGFPQKSKLWAGRRYMPAVRAWFDHQNGLTIDASTTRRERHGR